MTVDVFPVTSSLAEVRGTFGESLAVWADRVHQVTPHSWIAISGALQPDYNLALVHGGDVVREVTETVDAIRAEGIPSILMLAGTGLAGAQTLADAGWVCIGSMPFMGRGPIHAPVDHDIHELTVDELPAARDLASNAFDIGPEMAELLYSERVLRNANSLIAGLFVDGEMVCCGLACRAPGMTTGWALATKPGRRRSGYARRGIQSSFALDAHVNGPAPLYFLATPMGQPLYEALGFHILEYWQTWSRPRWILGGI